MVQGRLVDTNFSYSEDGKWYRDTREINLAHANALFLRMDRPFTDKQLRCLSQNFPKSLIINDPLGIIHTGSKEFLLNFPSICPAMTMCKNQGDIEDFLAIHDAVFKPMHGYGGQGIVRISRFGISEGSIKLTKQQAIDILVERMKSGEQYLAMEYMKNVGEGDKRIVVAGNTVLGATLRLPAQGSFMCNLKEGGTAHPAEPDNDEIEIAEQIIPILRKNGILIFGFDTLVNNDGKRILSEINTLNVGGFIQAQEFSGRPIIDQVAREFITYIKENKH